jgi:hypothetical protein
MAVVLTFAAKLPVVKVGRMAGQFAKPRSVADRDDRRRRAAELSRRHHQRHRVHAGSREPDPQRMLQAYNQSAATLNLLRAFASGGYADLHQRPSLDAGLRGPQPAGRTLPRSWPTASEALDFMEACGIDAETVPAAAPTRFLHQPRGAAAALRAGADPRRFSTDRRLVRHLGAHAVDRRPHPPASTARMSNSCAASEPDRHEMRPQPRRRTRCSA